MMRKTDLPHNNSNNKMKKGHGSNKNKKWDLK
jgi:hypothetical protein